MRRQEIDEKQFRNIERLLPGPLARGSYLIM